MDDMTRDQHADALAARQYGAIGHAQIGVTKGQIRRRRRSGRWRTAGCTDLRLGATELHARLAALLSE